MNTILRLREKDDVEYERYRLENLFGVDVTESLENDLIPLAGNLEQMINLPVNDWMETTDEDVFNDWADVGPCFGDECDVSI